MMSGPRILIVEDEGIEALDIQYRLRSLGYAADFVLSGEEAVKVAEETHPDLVLMDIMLQGGIDGVVAAGQIRDLYDIPVVYLTAYSDEATLQRAKISEPYGYVVKPFRERDMHIAIEMALYKHTMERRVKESEKWLSTTLRSIGDAAIATDKDGRITFMNAVAERLTGWKQKDVSNEKLVDKFKIVNRDTRRPVENPVTRVLAEGIVVGLANHTVLVAADGREIPIDDNAAPIKDDRGNVTGVILVFRDVTEREKAEEELRRAYDELEERVVARTADLALANERLKEEIEERKRVEDRLQEKNVELEDANLAKDRFLASMSHELRTPLNAVIGFTGTLLMRLPGPLTEDQEEQLQSIRQSALHLLSLINDLLDLAKIESGKVEIRTGPVDVAEVIREVMGTLRPMAGEKGLKFTYEVADGPAIIRSDRRALSQILLNLTSNAIKFTDKGSVHVEFAQQQRDGQLTTEIGVVDTGIGIREEDQEKLFEAFTQLDSTSLLSRTGAGLGLCLSQKLAQLIGGEISIESVYGKGSTFRLTLK